MKKKIIPNEKNLLKALRASAKAHNVEFMNWRPEGEIGIHSESVPVVADAKTIFEAFTDNSRSNFMVGYGFVNIALGGLQFKKELSWEDDMKLKMALPYNLKVNWETA